MYTLKNGKWWMYTLKNGMMNVYSQMMNVYSQNLFSVIPQEFLDHL